MGEAEAEKDKGTSVLYFWIGLAILYFIWDYFVLRNKRLKDTVSPENIRTNLYNLTVIGTAAVIFINGMKVLLVKLSTFEIPGITWIVRRLLPLFQLT